MDKFHRITLRFLRELQSFVPKHSDMISKCHVRDDSMYPTLKTNSIIDIDISAPLRSGAIVAISTESFIELREVQIHHGEFYLIAHNKKYPTISMVDFRALYPSAYFCGVVVQGVLNSQFAYSK
jgi:phage repressor protein C with HTH and peptisase S24 domain